MKTRYRSVAKTTSPTLMGPAGPKEYNTTGTMITASIVHPIEISGVREDPEESSSDERSQFINNPEFRVEE